MPTEGLLTEVLITERGSHAAAVAAVDATTIDVADVTDFTDYSADDTVDPDTSTTEGIGIVVDILGERYTVASVTQNADDSTAAGAGETYDLAADLTPGTLTLTEPLRAQVDEDDPVWLVIGDDVATDAYALVSFPQTAEVLGEDTDAGDIAQVPISYGQRASFPEGTRDPAVPIVVADDLSGVLDVPGVQPTIDGSTIINLPAPEIPTDGLPPVESPTPVVYSGLGSLQVRWTGITNADPVSYRVYVSTLDQYPPDAASLIATTTGTQVFIATDADGNRLVYGQPYFVSVEAFDADGAADPSPLVAGSVMQVTNEDIAAEFVYAGQIIANQIVGGEVTSPLVLSSSIKTATEGARVEIDGSGVVVYDSTGTPVVLVPTEGTAIFRGDAEIGDLTLVGGATLRGSTEVSRSAYIVLANKVSPSSSAPTLSNTWDTHPTDLVVPAPVDGEYPESYVDLPWTLQGVMRDTVYSRYVWWGYVTLENGNQEGLYFSSINADSPTVPTFQGYIFDDEMLALGYSGDSPIDANLPSQEPGYYYVTRLNDQIWLNWVPEGWDNDEYTGSADPVYRTVNLPNVANFRWAVTNISDGETTFARIYGAVRNTDGTVTLNVWNPNTSAVSMVAITNPGAEANWDSKWGRAGGAAGVGALVEDGNYIRLATTAASGSAAYTIGEKIDIPVVPGDRITAANRVWPGSASLLGKAAQLQILWWNASGTLISTASQAFTFPTSSAWVTASVESTAPAGAVRMSMRMVFTATATGQTVYGGTTSIYKAGGLSSPSEVLTLNTGAAITELVGLTIAQGDFAADRILLLERTGSTTTVRSFTMAGVRQAAEDFPLPTSGIRSLYWNNDTQWWESVDDNGTVYKHEPGTKSYDKLHASFTWKRGTQYESSQSSVATINHKRRSKLVVTIPPKVITGAADDPDSAGIYLGQGASVPGRTGMFLQTTITGTQLVVTDPLWSTANPPDPANNPKDFPSAIPGRFYSVVADAAGPLVDLKGDGTWRLGSLTGLASGAVNGAGRVQAGVSTYRATPTGSAPGAILGQEATPTVWSSSILRGFTYTGAGAWICQPGAAGTYLVWAKATWAADTVNDWPCGLQIWKNGVQMGGINDITLHSKSISNSTGPVLLAPIEIAVGDQMAMSIWQGSGTARTPNGVQFYMTPLLS